jgi:hypothetical protein
MFGLGFLVGGWSLMIYGKIRLDFYRRKLKEKLNNFGK